MRNTKENIFSINLNFLAFLTTQLVGMNVSPLSKRKFKINYFGNSKLLINLKSPSLVTVSSTSLNIVK